MKTLNVRQYPRSENAAITVTTVYVGASAELVRGFITTPLERAIAAADGIDYIQSQSKQGVSTITARLKLNYDANKALSEISSKVDAGPRRSAARSRSSGHQYRSRRFAIRLRLSEFHLGHPEAERDHRLSRAPRPAAPDGDRRRAKGGHPRRTHLCHAHLAEARPDGGVQHQPGQVRTALGRQQLSLRRRQHQRLAAFR